MILKYKIGKKFLKFYRSEKDWDFAFTEVLVEIENHIAQVKNSINETIVEEYKRSETIKAKDFQKNIRSSSASKTVGKLKKKRKYFFLILVVIIL